MSTFLQLKNSLKNIVVGGTTEINDVIRNEIANYYPFTWLRKSTSLTIDGSGQSDLPADFNITHKIPSLIDSNNQVYQEVDVTTYNDTTVGSVNIYYIDYNTSTDRWRVNSKTVSTTLTCVYYYIPAELTADADVCVVPDPDAVIYLAAARVWIGIYFDETDHDRFQALGTQRLDLMVARDKRARPERRRSGTAYSVDQGWNT
jgi:hypothetical protein